MHYQSITIGTTPCLLINHTDYWLDQWLLGDSEFKIEYPPRLAQGIDGAEFQARLSDLGFQQEYRFSRWLYEQSVDISSLVGFNRWVIQFNHHDNRYYVLVENDKILVSHNPVKA
jgi:hypothetical protein